MTASLAVERFDSGRARGAALVDLCRPQISVVPTLVLLASGVSAGLPWSSLVAGFVVILSGCAIAAALNDRADVESDRVNGRVDRPLATGALGTTDVVAVVVGASLAGLVAEWWLPQPNGIFGALAGGLLGWASACEPLALQRRGVVGLVALASAYLLVPVVLVLGPARALLVAPIALLGAGVLAHKDVRDEVGDRAAGKRTLLVRVGYLPMAITGALLGAAGCVGLALTLGDGWWIGPALVSTGSLTSVAWRRNPRALATARWAMVVATMCAAAQAAA